MTLKELKPGQKATVIKINHGGNLLRRLFQIGLMPGVELTVVSQHPFKGPVVFVLGNATFALGRGVAGAVEVQTVDKY